MAQSDQPAWPELKTFHSFMAGTFHPAEEGNLAPLKAKADSLLVASGKWQASPIPANYKPTETRAALAKLVKQCGIISNAVKKNATDTELNKMITKAHEIFHKIVGECRKEE